MHTHTHTQEISYSVYVQHKKGSNLNKAKSYSIQHTIQPDTDEEINRNTTYKKEKTQPAYPLNITE
jgi:hypothetical protein